jgi:hypothetical protein
MSQIRYRIFTERGSARAPAPFGEQRSHDSQDRTPAQSNRDLTDRKPAGDHDEIAASVVLGYN